VKKADLLKQEPYLTLSEGFEILSNAYILFVCLFTINLFHAEGALPSSLQPLAISGVHCGTNDLYAL
jgi:hypothetical protein